MGFTSKRGPKARSVTLKVIEGGKKENAVVKKAPIKINREAIDICYEKGLINSHEHRAAIHFRWLYTLKFGAPGISAVNPEAETGRSLKINDEEWQAQREREYAMAVEKLRQVGALKIVMNLAVFGYFPRFLVDMKMSRRSHFQQSFTEITKLREGLQLLVNHWGKAKAK